ncbi:MAG TPA: hypothetical protein VF306_22665, partial [Pirellulales bacterium]
QYSPVDDVAAAASALTSPEPAPALAEMQSSTAAAREPSPAVAEFAARADETADTDVGDAPFEPQVSAMRVAPRVRRQTSPFAMFGQIAGMALGGVLGLAIGYWVLLWLGGAQADFLQLRGKLPRWLVPPARRHHAPAQGPLAKQAPEKSEPDQNAIEPAAWPSAAGLAGAPGLAVESADSMSLPSVPGGASDALEPGLAGKSPALLQSVPADGETGTLIPSQGEPASLESPASASTILPAGYLGPREFKLRTAGDLRAAIEQTERALRCPRCQMPGAVRLVSFESAAAGFSGRGLAPPCDACRGKPVIHLGAAGFAQLCQLGEAATFVQFGGDDTERQQLRAAAETILMALGNQRDKRETIGRLAGAWLDDGHRPTNGIVIAGTIEDARPQGDLFAIRVMLLSCGKHIEVVCPQPPEPALRRRDHVVMLGSVVDGPEDNLVGYTGDALQVVWGGMHLKVAQ